MRASPICAQYLLTRIRNSNRAAVILLVFVLAKGTPRRASIRLYARRLRADCRVLGLRCSHLEPGQAPEGIDGFAAPTRLSKIDFCLPVNDTKIVIRLGARARGMRPPRGTKAIFRWELNSARAKHFAQLLDVIAGAGSPCHHYLECGAEGEITVKVSIGEYGDDFPRS
jgi:hypothetical protein